MFNTTFRHDCLHQWMEINSRLVNSTPAINLKIVVLFPASLIIRRTFKNLFFSHANLFSPSRSTRLLHAVLHLPILMEVQASICIISVLRLR